MLKGRDYNVELAPGHNVNLTICGPKRVRFHWLTGDLTYGGKWISNKQNNGKFDYYFVIELLNWKETVGRDAPVDAYNVTLSVVSPDQAKEHVKSALDCCGITEKMLECATSQRDEVLVEALHDYGLSVPVWGDNGNNAKQLLRQAREQAQSTESLFGFAMDRPVNRIGTTGWEALRGDLLAGLTRIGA